VVVVTSLTIFSYSQLLSWARYFIQITTFRGTPIGLAILSAGASMLLYHHQSIPLIRQIVVIGLGKRRRRSGDNYCTLRRKAELWTIAMTIARYKDKIIFFIMILKVPNIFNKMQSLILSKIYLDS